MASLSVCLCLSVCLHMAFYRVLSKKMHVTCHMHVTRWAHCQFQVAIFANIMHWVGGICPRHLDWQVGESFGPQCKCNFYKSLKALRPKKYSCLRIWTGKNGSSEIFLILSKIFISISSKNMKIKGKKFWGRPLLTGSDGNPETWIYFFRPK